MRRDVEEIAVVEDPDQDLVHVIGGVVGVGNEAVELEVVRGDLRLQTRVDHRSVVEGVGRQELQEVPHVLESRLLRLHHLVDVAVAGLIIGAAEFVEADVLAGDVFDDIRSGDEHVALIAHGDDQIGLDG